jgi:predicted thioesterase
MQLATPARHAQERHRLDDMPVPTFEHTVTTADTAAVLGSGDLPVLATPRLINWLERATFTAAAAVVVPPETTVGTLVRVEHLKASPVGSVITLSCTTPMSDGRRLIFHVRATDQDGNEVAAGELHRRVVDPSRFMARFTERPGPSGS